MARVAVILATHFSQNVNMPEQNAASDDQVQSPDLGSENDEEEHFVVTRAEEERNPEADAEFDRELAKMMSESAEPRRNERRPMTDLALPLRRNQRDAVNKTEDTNGTESNPNKTKFSLLSKRGNKPQVKTIRSREIELSSLLTVPSPDSNNRSSV